MSEHNPYTPPGAPVADSAALPNSITGRKGLVPLWIKIFGWFFIVAGVLIPIISVVAIAAKQPASYELFGLAYHGSPLHPLPLFIAGLFVALGGSAFGLLFGKGWGVQACLITGYVGVAVCIGTTLYSIAQGSLNFRLELLIQIPYLHKLHQIRKTWAAQERSRSEA